MEENVLIDSSSWIDFFRGSEPVLIKVMGTLLEEKRVLICGPVYLEVLGACHSEKEFKTVAELYNQLTFLEINKNDFLETVSLKRKMKKRGMTVPNVDLLIANLALKHSCYLLHHDSDFDRIAGIMPLKILHL